MTSPFGLSSPEQAEIMRAHWFQQPDKSPPKGSLTRQTLIKMAVRIAIVIVAITTISYVHMVASLEDAAVGQLEKYIVQRGQRERSIFALAEDNLAVFKEDFLQRLKALGNDDPKEEFERLFFRDQDGLIRNRPEGFDGRTTSGVCIDEALALDAAIRRRVVTAYHLVNAYGRAWHNRFQDTYVSMPENMNVIYWPEVPTWCQEMTPDLYIPNEAWFLVSDKRHNPKRELAWTGLYFDKMAKLWMVSAEMPIDLDGKHIGTVGHDIVVAELFKRTLNDRLAGGYNMIFRKDGRLIAHPRLMDAIQDKGGEFDILESRDPNLVRIFQVVSRMGTEEVVIENTEDEEYLAVARIDEPDWFLLTILPKAVVTQPAFDTARFILILGCISLMIDVAVLFFVLKTQIAAPLNKLTEATERITEGSREVQLDTSRPDELGRLAYSFNEMVRAVADRDSQLSAQNTELDRQVQVRTAQLRAALEESETTNRALVESKAELEAMQQAALEARATAEEANRAKSAFLANMSHELRTPLNAIIGYSEILAEEAEESGQEHPLADLQKIRSAGQHLLASVNDVLDLSKIEAGKMELHLENFEVLAMLQEVVSTIAPLVEKNGNRLEVRCAEGLGAIRADLTKLRQALFNLLSNACKFTRGGVITLEVAREGIDGAGWLSFRVADTGIGISPDQMKTLFQAFSQADAWIAQKYGGTGLGLIISRRFCQMMGGDITVESTLGAGSIFTIRLPIDEAKPETTPTLGSEDLSQPQGLPRVLVIDDDPAVHDLMRRFLDKQGINMVGAGSGEEGLRLAKKLRPAAIMLDVLMPGMDGWAVLTRLKADPELAPIPVIMITMLDDRNMGFALGATDFLTKPIDRDHLAHLLQKYRCTHPPCPVLVVEDEAGLRELIRRLLEKEGWVVAEAENGRVALERVAENRPELIVLDLMMPEMDGFAFLEALREKEAWRAIPIVVVTAKDLTPEDQRRLNGYVQQVLHKGAYERGALLREVGAWIAACLPKVT